MKGLYVLFCTLILGASCTRQKNANNLTEKHLWTIDVTKKYPTKDIYLQDIADIEYIPLETNDSILWKGREIRYMDEEYIMGASGDMGVYFHDRTGKALHSFQRKGSGPQEYTGFTQIQYDKEHDEIYIKSFDDKYLIYNRKGNFKRSFKLASFQTSFDTAIEYFILNDEEFIEYLLNQNYYRRISRQTGKHLGDIKLSGENPNMTLAFQKNGMRFSTAVNHSTKTENGYILTAFPSDTTYLLTKDLQLTPIGVRTPPINSMEVPIFLLPVKNTMRYYFMYTVKKEDRFPTKLYMLDKKENQIYYLKNYFKNKDFEGKTHSLDIYGTASNANLPSNVCVESIRAHKLIEAYQEGKLSGKLKEIAADLKEDDNPVLMVVKFKE